MSVRLASGALQKASRVLAYSARMLVCVLVCRLFRSIERMYRHRFNKPTVLHALEPDQPVGKLLDFG